MSELSIDLSHLEKHYGTHRALDDVSLSVSPGQCVALLGHNGAGKTTLMKILLGLSSPTKGTVRILGKDPSAENAIEARRQMGFLPENVRFHEAMSGIETLNFYARLKGVAIQNNNELFERVGLEQAANRRVKTYSKGMRQRLGLAQALLGRPKLLLLDEPTSGLDPLSRRSFYEIIQQLSAEGTTIFLSSHALTELEARTERVVIMRQGKLVADGSLKQLRKTAGLPVRIRVSAPESGRAIILKNDFGQHVTTQQFNGHGVQLTCLEADKVDLVRQLSALGAAIDDIEILPTSLDDIYAHFGTQVGAKPCQ